MPDLRNFIQLLEKQSELLKIHEEIDWKYEIGDKIRQICIRNAKPPAILFECIKDYPGFLSLPMGLALTPR